MSHYSCDELGTKKKSSKSQLTRRYACAVYITSSIIVEANTFTDAFMNVHRLSNLAVLFSQEESKTRGMIPG